MAADLKEQLDRVRNKANVLVEKYTRLHDAFKEAKAEVESLQARLIAKDKEIETLRMKVEHLSIASTVKLSGEDLQSTRRMIADLVREIDRCIIDLSD